MAALAGVANGQVVLTMSYDDLSGSYNSITNQFSAVAANSGTHQSSGFSQRSNTNAPPGGTANSFAGTLPGLFANFVMNITVAPGPLTGVGHFRATDADGDTVDGDVNGAFAPAGGGFMAFNGAISNVVFADNNAADNRFNGTSTGSWSMAFPFSLEGAIVQLSSNITNFNQGFSDATVGYLTQFTQVSVPAPLAAFSGAGLLGVMSIRRRRNP
jgi:hypothetical protein